MKSVCLRKRWSKCPMRCIVTIFLAFIEWISTFYFVCLWVRIWNNTLKKYNVNWTIINPFRVILKLSWYWNNHKNANEIIVCNNESIWNTSRYLFSYFWLAKWTKWIWKQRYPSIGFKLCTYQCEWVGTKNSSFAEEQVSRNMRIE